MSDRLDHTKPLWKGYNQLLVVKELPLRLGQGYQRNKAALDLVRVSILEAAEERQPKNLQVQ